MRSMPQRKKKRKEMVSMGRRESGTDVMPPEAQNGHETFIVKDPVVSVNDIYSTSTRQLLNALEPKVVRL